MKLISWNVNGLRACIKKISNVTHIGPQPVNLLVGYYHNSESPSGGAQNQTRVQINFLFPTGLK